jgi:hypothetical protein
MIPQDEVEGSLVVYQCLGHLVPSNQELDHEGQVLIGKLCPKMIFGFE